MRHAILKPMGGLPLTERILRRDRLRGELRGWGQKREVGEGVGKQGGCSLDVK